MKSWIPKATLAVQTLSSEIAPIDILPPRPPPLNDVAALNLAKLWPTWNQFAYSLSRYLYPKRFPIFRLHTILNQ
jgi:hypothetical protein